MLRFRLCPHSDCIIINVQNCVSWCCDAACRARFKPAETQSLCQVVSDCSQTKPQWLSRVLLLNLFTVKIVRAQAASATAIDADETVHGKKILQFWQDLDHERCLYSVKTRTTDTLQASGEIAVDIRKQYFHGLKDCWTFRMILRCKRWTFEVMIEILSWWKSKCSLALLTKFRH